MSIKNFKLLELFATADSDLTVCASFGVASVSGTTFGTITLEKPVKTADEFIVYPFANSQNVLHVGTKVETMHFLVNEAYLV